MVFLIEPVGSLSKSGTQVELQSVRRQDAAVIEADVEHVGLVGDARKSHALYRRG